MWAFNWLLNSHIGFDLRPNYTGKPHVEDIIGFWNGFNNCKLISKKKRCNGPNDPQPDCQRVPEANPHAVQQMQQFMIGLGLGVAGGAVASQPELWPAIPALGKLAHQYVH
jgi:hypothetical protein